MNDPHIVARLQSGEVAAFDEVFTAHRARVFSFLKRLSGNQAVAEELSQEVWLRLARAAPTLSSDTRLLSWLFTVARNLFISHQRLSLREVEARLVVLWERGRTPVTPLEAFSGAQLGARLEVVLATLPVPHREILLLVCVEGLEPIEAAKVLGLSPEAARKRLDRARALLEARLVDDAAQKRESP